MRDSILENPLTTNLDLMPLQSISIVTPRQIIEQPKNDIQPQLQLKCQCDTIIEDSTSATSLVVQNSFSTILAKNSLKMELQQLQETVKKTQKRIKDLECRYKLIKANIAGLNQEILKWEQVLQ